MKRVQGYIESYKKDLAKIIDSPENYNEQIVIYDASKDNNFLDYEGMISSTHTAKAHLLNQIKIMKVIITINQ